MKTINFVDEEPPTNTAALWCKPKQSNYADQLLKPEYRNRVLRFEPGSTWFRILPPIQPTTKNWLLQLDIQNYPGGRFLHPRTLTKGARSTFDHAYSWSKTHCPNALYSKHNRDGARLLTDPMSVCWVIVEQNGKNVARLLLAKGYDGSRGGAPGLGYQISKAAQERDEEGHVITDAIKSNAGLQLCVEKVQPLGVKFASYSVRVGRVAAPMAPLIESLDPDEKQVLTPLENVVGQLSDEEQWQCLAKVIAPSTVTEIRASQKLTQ